MIIKDWEKILSGEKTQHRVIVKKGEFFEDADPSFDLPAGVYRWLNNFAATSRTVYAVGKTYAVQSGSGRIAEGRIRITGIRHDEDVRTISDEDVRAEGYGSLWSFFHAWCEMHDTKAHNDMFKTPTFVASKWLNDTHLNQGMRDWLKNRPAARYDAWVLSFEVVRG
jgi:hypothetical protein